MYAATFLQIQVIETIFVPKIENHSEIATFRN